MWLELGGRAANMRDMSGQTAHDARAGAGRFRRRGGGGMVREWVGGEASGKMVKA